MRFIHTADWQLGLKLRYVADERAAQLRFQRFQTVRAIADLAREYKVDCVLVAGDVLDDNALGKDTLQLTSDALRTFSGIPVVLLPGNHDAATPDCALTRLYCPDGIHVLTKREPIEIGGATIFPCPLMRRHEADDPTGWLPPRASGEGIRIALAHGGVIDFAQSADSETPNLIDADRVLFKGFDYLALGDWHSTFSLGPRVWYSGAPEPTRFKETSPGNVLLVEIDGPGAEPRVTPIRVAQTNWQRQTIEMVEDAQVEELRRALEAMPELGVTLLELTVGGSITLSARDALDALLADYGERLAHLRVDLSRLQVTATDGEIAAMGAESFLASALSRLRASDDAAAEDAVRLMYRLQREAANAPA